jgi:hypothetical protein
MLFAAAAMVAGVGFGLVRLLPPENDVSGSFDTQRALRDLAVIAREPHVTGSMQDRRVADFVAQRLRTLGLTVTVQEGAWRSGGQAARTLALHNVIGRLAGTGGGRGAVMLCAHHDSARPAPGAADDGAAVAALLEVARLLAVHPPQRDVLFLITDGEEAGLAGARLFAASTDLPDHVAVVLNFDARGSSGPAAMFETSDNNAALVEQYALAAPHPLATSLAGAIYRRMPNRTDFTVFKNAGLAGLNFAFLGSFANYHHTTDDIAHLSLRSLRHQGETALALTQRLGNVDPGRADGDAVFFDLWSFLVVRYPQRWAEPLAWLTAGVAAGVVALALRRRRAAVGGMVGGVALAMAGAGIAATLTFAVARALGVRWGVPGFDWLCAGLTAYAAALVVAMLWLMRRWIAAESVACGMIALWAILGLAAAHALPGASYLFVFPTWLAAVSMVIVLMRWNRHWVGFAIVVFLATAAVGMNAGHLYLAALAVELDGLHWVVAGETAMLWLVIPVLGVWEFLSSHGLWPA